MEDSDLKLRRFLRGWWLFLFTGLQLIASGIWIGMETNADLGSLTRLFTFVYVGNGASEIAFAMINRRLIIGWRGILALGIFELLLGVLLFTSPPAHHYALLGFVAIWLFSRGILLFLTAIDFEAIGPARNWVAYAIGGLAATASAILVFIQRNIDFPSVVVWTVVGTIVTGGFFILYSLQLRTARFRIDEVGQKIRRMKSEKVY